MMDWKIVWLFVSPVIALAGMIWGMFAMIHADEARSRKKNKATDG